MWQLQHSEAGAVPANAILHHTAQQTTTTTGGYFTCQAVRQHLKIKRHTNCKSFSIPRIISDSWHGTPDGLLLIPLMMLAFPKPDAEITGEHIEDALLRRMNSMCGR